MHIRTFRAANLNAALAMIREQMGPDASVLHTRQVDKSGWNLFGRQRIEVTAGLRHTPSTASSPPLEKHETSRQAPNPLAPNPLLEQFSTMGLPNSVTEKWLRQSTGIHDLKSSAVCDSPEDTRKKLIQWLGKHIPVSRPIDVSGEHRRIVALVGATGVGKTTTIAKLAGQFRLEHQSRVGLLTVDAFRAAAVDQIGAFANALQIPLEVVRSPDEVEPALDRLTDLDLLLVDTVGQSPRETSSIHQLARLLKAICPDETHLVVDANSSILSARDCLAAFSKLSPTALILSKVDEVRTVAPSIAATLESSLGFSYMTTGQSVPHDIELANPIHLAELTSGLAETGPSSVISSREKVA